MPCTYIQAALTYITSRMCLRFGAFVVPGRGAFSAGHTPLPRMRGDNGADKPGYGRLLTFDYLPFSELLLYPCLCAAPLPPVSVWQCRP
ncbi:hypothetical protein GDO81_013967 [Engystomops pustulosus]|uniref:Uncharacterized protein n=1 Tax=Engystomops pustulosus TaxID=76066 RepID=A0AAV7B785_ENGPU|nr:hypothetical protein GDO81_013967 [Engystomops pustulosus]